MAHVRREDGGPNRHGRGDAARRVRRRRTSEQDLKRMGEDGSGGLGGDA
jgi:hypothetical protein